MTIEMYEGSPVLAAADSKELKASVEKFKADHPEIPIEVPYVVRIEVREGWRGKFFLSLL